MRALLLIPLLLLASCGSKEAARRRRRDARPRLGVSSLARTPPSRRARADWSRRSHRAARADHAPRGRSGRNGAGARWRRGTWGSCCCAWTRSRTRSPWPRPWPRWATPARLGDANATCCSRCSAALLSSAAGRPSRPRPGGGGDLRRRTGLGLSQAQPRLLRGHRADQRPHAKISATINLIVVAAFRHRSPPPWWPDPAHVGFDPDGADPARHRPASARVRRGGQPGPGPCPAGRRGRLPHEGQVAFADNRRLHRRQQPDPRPGAHRQS